MNDSHERAWAAGFFDGEGCTTFSDRYLYMQVKQVDEYGIRRFDAATSFLGKVRGPVVSKVEARSPIYIWRAHGQEAVEVYQRLFPWLGPAKRDQFGRCLDRWNEVRRGRTHCREGHLLSPDNIYRDKRNNGRTCKICRRARSRELYWKKKTLDSTGAVAA